MDNFEFVQEDLRYPNETVTRYIAYHKTLPILFIQEGGNQIKKHIKLAMKYGKAGFLPSLSQIIYSCIPTDHPLRHTNGLHTMAYDEELDEIYTLTDRGQRWYEKSGIMPNREIPIDLDGVSWNVEHALLMQFLTNNATPI